MLRFIQFQHRQVPSPQRLVDQSTLPSLPDCLLQGVTIGTDAVSKISQIKFNPQYKLGGLFYRDAQRGTGAASQLTESYLNLGMQHVNFANDYGSTLSV